MSTPYRYRYRVAWQYRHDAAPPNRIKVTHRARVLRTDPNGVTFELIKTGWIENRDEAETVAYGLLITVINDMRLQWRREPRPK